MRAPNKEASAARTGPKGRSQLLIYMQPNLIRQLELAELAKGKPDYELAELAIAQRLKKHQREIRQATALISRGGKL